MYTEFVSAASTISALQQELEVIQAELEQQQDIDAKRDDLLASRTEALEQYSENRGLLIALKDNLTRAHSELGKA